MAQKNTFQPCTAASSMLGSMSTKLQSMIQPARPDQRTEVTMPIGTAREALSVSSAVCAEASYPVIVYTGSSRPRRNAMSPPTATGQTALAPSVPV
jgi:hypothetical protein